MHQRVWIAVRDQDNHKVLRYCTHKHCCSGNGSWSNCLHLEDLEKLLLTAFMVIWGLRDRGRPKKIAPKDLERRIDERLRNSKCIKTYLLNIRTLKGVFRAALIAIKIQHRCHRWITLCRCLLLRAKPEKVFKLLMRSSFLLIDKQVLLAAENKGATRSNSRGRGTSLFPGTPSKLRDNDPSERTISETLKEDIRSAFQTHNFLKMLLELKTIHAAFVH